jgi:hypothetical protein
LLLAANADATGIDMGLVFGLDGMYIPKALRTETSDLVNVPQTICVFDGIAGAIAIPQRYTSDRSSLGKMLGIARRLKQMNPQLMAIKHDTIKPYSKKIVPNKADWKNSYAFYQPLCHDCYGTGEEQPVGPNYFESELGNKSKPTPCTKCNNGINPHIYVNPEFLRDQKTYIDHNEALALNHLDWEWDTIRGDVALILLACHELAHDFTQGLKNFHGKKWQQWFSKFLYQIIHDIN